MVNEDIEGTYPVFVGIKAGESPTEIYICRNEDCTNNYIIFINPGDDKICKECGEALGRLVFAVRSAGQANRGANCVAAGYNSPRAGYNSPGMTTQGAVTEEQLEPRPVELDALRKKIGISHNKNYWSRFKGWVTRTLTNSKIWRIDND